MPTDNALAQAIQQLIDWCSQHAAPQQPAVGSLPHHWFERMRGQPHPLWIDIAHHLFSHCEDDAVRIVLQHAVALRQQATGSARGPHKPGFGPVYPGFVQAFSPQEVLLLAAHAHGWRSPQQTLTPTDLASRLLFHRLQQPHNTTPNGPQVDESLNLVQMLVFRYAHHTGYEGLLLRLELQAVDSTPAPGDDPYALAAGQLIRAPSAGLFWLDEAMQSSLDRVQDLLARVLKPGAPAITWGFASLAQPGDAVQSVLQLGGGSATAALAYGALYLLRNHLDTSKPHIQALAQHLCAIEEPSAVSITADLNVCDGPNWPRLLRVDGVPEKLAALARASHGSTPPHCLIATAQEHDPRLAPAQRADNLGQLIERAEHLTSTLSEDGRLLHQAMLAGASDAAIAAQPALQAAM
jgi:hypothetical protein